MAGDFATRPVPTDLERLAGLTIVPRRYYGRWVAAAIILLLFVWVVKAFAEGQIAWKVVGQFFTAPAILNGLVNTVIMTACAMALGIVLGVLFAIMYMSPNPVLRGSALFTSGSSGVRRCCCNCCSGSTWPWCSPGLEFLA